MSIRGGARRRVTRSAWAVLAVLLAPFPAAADSWTLYLEPGYAHDDIETTDQSGKTTRFASDRLLQNYRLAADKHLFDNLSLTGAGSFQSTRAWTTNEGTTQFGDSQVKSLFANLALTTPGIVSGLSYSHNERANYPGLTFVADSYSGYGSWRPVELPQLDLRVTRDDVHDADRRVQDTSTNSVLVNARYAIDRLELRGVFSWINPTDHLNQSESNALDQSLQATYSNVFGRTSIYASALVDGRSLSNTFSDPSATFSQQQHPIAGLSTVEIFPAIPEKDALSPNPAIVDGNTADSASVDLGFGRSVAGDRNLRDVGAQLGDVVTDVNTLYLWVNKTLPAEILGALSFAVYASDDNANWSAVNVVRPPAFGAVQDRVELTIATTRARYLKVVVAPLGAAATTDPTFREILVTELQLLLVLPASAVAREQSSLSTMGTITARTAILRKPNLDYDLSAQVDHRTDSGLTLYSIVNGLSYAQTLSPALVLSARASRQDQDAGNGHEATWQWSAALTARPIPTVQATAAYSGLANENLGTMTQGVSLFGRADWYEGVSSQANAAITYSHLRDDSNTTGGIASASTTVTPNKWMTFTAAGLYSVGITTATSTAPSTSRFARLDGSVSFTPAPALSASASVSRVFYTAETTLATVLVNFAPLRGALQLTVAYSRTLDTAAEQTVQTIAPALRWYITHAVSLNAAYTLVDTDAPVQEISARTFLATLRITL